MTSRERVRRAIEFDGPDRVPHHTYIFPGAWKNHGQALADLLNEFPDDFGGRDYKVPQDAEQAEGIEEFRDAWGTLWIRRKDYTSGEVKEPAIKDWSEWPKYEFPPLPDPDHYKRIAERAADPNREFMLTEGGGSLFQHLQHLRGPANFFMDLADDRQELHALADRVVDYLNRHNTRCLEAGSEMLIFGDDLGSQRALLFSPKHWASFFRPRYKKLFAPARERGRHVWFHSDGWMWEVFDDMIEDGVTVMNPQHVLMGTARVGEKIGGRVCVRSDLDRQHILPHGTPEQVAEHVKEVIRAFGRFNGGLIFHGEIGPNVPLANIRAMHETCREYGKYPLEWL